MFHSFVSFIQLFRSHLGPLPRFLDLLEQLLGGGVFQACLAVEVTPVWVPEEVFPRALSALAMACEFTVMMFAFSNAFPTFVRAMN